MCLFHYVPLPLPYRWIYINVCCLLFSTCANSIIICRGVIQFSHRGSIDGYKTMFIYTTQHTRV